MRKFLIIMLGVCIIHTAAGCGNERPKPRLPLGEKLEDVPNYVIQGFKLKSTEEAGLQWELEARGAQVFEIKKKAYLQFFTMKVFEKPGVYSLLSGERAVIDTDTNFIEATGDVRLRSDAGMVLLTEKFFWDDDKRIAYGDAAVTVIKDKTVLKGVGFESDMHMKNLKLNSRVNLKARDIGDD